MTEKDVHRFYGMGLPWFYMLATAVAVFPCYTYIRKNTENVFQDVLADPAAYRQKLIRIAILLLASVVTVCLSIFLFFSPASQYALLSVLLTLVAVTSVFHPERHLYSQRVAIAYVTWASILFGITFKAFGILPALSDGVCRYTYGDYADVMCIDGWVTFCVFCAILMIGCTFFIAMLLVEVTVSDSVRAAQASSADASYAPIESVGYGSTAATPSAAAGLGDKYERVADE